MSQSPEPQSTINSTALLDRLRTAIGSVVLGNTATIDRVICCLLARGHLLLEDVPGVGKTLLATALARSIDCSFTRIQLTPDLMPTDILGVSVLNRSTNAFEFKPGPIFANVVLADEINRTPPRTQAALLEAMSEGRVSIDGHTSPLPKPFMVVATQNPTEFEGTYDLPENQLDRFLMRLSLGYPSAAAEAEILDRRPSGEPLAQLRAAITGADVIALQASVDAVGMPKAIRDYIIMIANATRVHPDVAHGLSPRGSLALAQAARATAFLAGRTAVLPGDVLANAQATITHRLVLKNRINADASRAGGIVDACIESVASPT